MATKPQQINQSISDISLSAEQVEGEYIQPRFIPLSYLEKRLDDSLWERNAKKHDSNGILQSIEKYGFVDYPKWDSNLNGNQGGIVYGNGRTKAVVEVLIAARKNGQTAPRGIPVDKTSGEWCIPIGFGIDQSSEAQAEALGIDHNNLTLSGIEFSDLDIAKMYDSDDYLTLLRSLSEQDELPVTVDDDAIAMLSSFMENKDLPPGKSKEINPESFTLNHTCPKCGFEFNAKE